MRLLIFAIIVFGAPILNAQQWHSGSFSKEANPVLHITQALVESKIDELTPKTSTYNGRGSSYHLGFVRYLGGVSRANEHFTVASVLFIRSSPEGSELPPARGHGFLLMLDENYRIASYCRIDFPDQIDLIDSQLFRIGTIPSQSELSLIGDLTVSDIPSRSRGFLIDGDAFLPYPFADRIEQPEPEKEPAADMKKQETDGGLKPDR